ncbi:homer protein homolog 1 isoform X2 [Austrofundulus limnaeus]|uniref:Homer protein homolog 1 isoform X2 n=1 Tax=Austrofundulus limnaeus TaxID=52670 RepID=A0A2I4C6Y9_AUSLI|nr:PREDICTED: homer protein homolog 1-like isoform X2 [Austrofundulus limnaeus]
MILPAEPCHKPSCQFGPVQLDNPADKARGSLLTAAAAACVVVGHHACSDTFCSAESSQQDVPRCVTTQTCRAGSSWLVLLAGRESTAGSGAAAAANSQRYTRIILDSARRQNPANMGEQPIFSTRAHVFQIDPTTKKNWVPTSKHAVTVSYFFDSTRNVYRIISLDGSKAIINSTITPNMTFTKTSQKFGQWADSRANTVYGLGFSSESHLVKFADKFAEFKEAARLAKERSQEKIELTSTPSQESAPGDLQSPLTSESINGTEEDRGAPGTPQHSEARAEPSQNALPMSHSSSSISKHWEAELAALKGNNAKLTAALLESTANVKQWKQQLAAYQEEAERLHKRVPLSPGQTPSSVRSGFRCLCSVLQVTELECVSGQTTVIKSQKTELNRTIEELELALKAKEEELESLKAEVEGANEFKFQKDSLTQKLKESELRNQTLEAQLSELEQRLESSQQEREACQKNLRSLLQLLDSKIFELTELRDALAKMMESS